MISTKKRIWCVGLLMGASLTACLSEEESGEPSGPEASLGVAESAATATSCDPKSGRFEDPNTGIVWTGAFNCHNGAGAPLYADPNKATVVGWMDTTTSWFVCYARGAVHGGNNDVWYYTRGDRAASGQSARKGWGYMPAQHLTTQVDPYPGIPECPWAEPGPQTCAAKSKNVTDSNSGRSWSSVSYCHNGAGAALYADPSSTTVVGWMDSTTSWFACYARGATHAGNNDVWYYTQGDRTASGQGGRKGWGYMPAVSLTTQIDPYPGIPECQGTPGSTTPVINPNQCSSSSGCVEPPALQIEKERMKSLGATFSGICGNAAHTYGYHIAPSQLPASDYSLRGPHNTPRCKNEAAAIDIGMNWPASRTWLKWLIGEIRAGRLQGITEVIGSYGDAQHVMYWSTDDTPGWPDVGIDYYRVKGGEGHYDWSHVAIARSTTNVDHNILRHWTRNGFVPPTDTAPPPVEDVECFVFDSGYANIAGPSNAIFFRGPNAACIGDGTAAGTCRRWFGRCRTKSKQVPVTFEAFENGHGNPTAGQDAVYIRGPESACVPDGSSTGACRRWFGEPKAADGRPVVCKAFDDGFANQTAEARAFFYRGENSVCVPGGSAGECRKWFGLCQAR